MQRLDDILIVPAGPGDAPALGEVHVRAWRETYAGLLPAGYLAQMNPHLYARRWRRQLTLAKPPELVMAAEGREGLVGYCAGHVGPEGIAEVSTLYLLRTAQKLGLGRRLLAVTARTLKTQGASAMKLWVLSGNVRARGFYEHLGAEAAGARPVRGWGGDLRETAYVWRNIGDLADLT